MKQYKMAQGWAAFIYIFSPVLIGVSVWGLTLPFKDGDYSPDLTWVIIPIALGMIILMIFGLIETYKGRVIITENEVISISSISTKRLKIDEIRGYSKNENYLFIEPNSSDKKRIKISNYIGGYHEILYWLSQRFSDLDEEQAQKEEQEILNDQKLGWNKAERIEKLNQARRTASILNWAGGISAAWIFFYPTPYQYSILVSILIPIFAVIVVKNSNGLIRLDEKKNSAYPSAISALIFPSCGLMLRAILDFEIFEYQNVWSITALLTVFCLLLLLINQTEITFKKKSDIVSISSLFLFLFMYNFGVVIHYNCYYDKSEPQYYKAEILDKRISSGKSRTYYVKLSPWGYEEESDEVSVGKNLYERAKIGNEVNIYYREGKLEIPWIIVTDE